MDSMPYNYNNMEDLKPIFTTASDNNQGVTTTVTESFTPSDNRNSGNGSIFSPLAPPFQSRITSADLISLVTPHEPRAADPAPSCSDIDEVLMNLRINGADSLFDDTSEQNANNFFLGSRVDSSASSQRNIWSENPTNSRNADMVDTFDFFVKSLSSANNYVSMLTREQLSVLQSIRPSLLYEFLQEVARVRSDKRLRRALPHECAFCKNNGENEENYSSHALKDWRGRVECPVLRAFRCPRCGATGDRAHTIKYCPRNAEGLDRPGSLLRRRMSSSGSFVIGEGARVPAYSAPTTPVSTPGSNTINNSFWSNFSMN